MLIDTAFYRGTVMAQVLNDYKNKKIKNKNSCNTWCNVLWLLMKWFGNWLYTLTLKMLRTYTHFCFFMVTITTW